MLTHRSAKGGFVTLMLQPPEQDRRAADTTPKELIFVLDTSGSMSGFPIEKAKESMLMALDGLYPQDTFNLITFSGDTEILFPEPVPATADNVADAKQFLQSRTGGGGTQMMQAIRRRSTPTVKTGALRIVCFMTDGDVGNDMEIMAEMRSTPMRASSPSASAARSIVSCSRMAHWDGAKSSTSDCKDDGSAAARRFHERIRNPLLTDMAIDWGGLPVSDVHPAQIRDLFGDAPVVVTARYAGPANGTVRLRGKSGGHEVSRSIAVQLPAAEPAHDSLASLWARANVEDLMALDYAGAQRGVMNDTLRGQITQLGLDYNLVTQFTSFVAVEERMVTSGEQARRVEVPVNLPEGMHPSNAPGGGGGGAYGPGSGGGIGSGLRRRRRQRCRGRSAWRRGRRDHRQRAIGSAGTTTAGATGTARQNKLSAASSAANSGA